MLYSLDPLCDARWRQLVTHHPDASVFHTPEWLSALRQTYRYEPIVFTDAAPGEPLQCGIVFCRVSSWLTGRRLVSVPFSDHAAPLLRAPQESSNFLAMLKGAREHVRFLEIRIPDSVAVPEGWALTEKFCTHSIDLRPDSAAIFRRFHKSCIQRVIRKAEGAGLTCACGSTEPLLRGFYALHTQTRQKHQMPVQPIEWFRNVLQALGQRARIYIADHDGRPAAAILTLEHGTSLVYKYGCSNVELNRLGATPWLFWRAIQDGKAAGLQQFDLGRSDFDNDGLITFKDHLGGDRSELRYYRFNGTALQGAGARAHFSYGHLARRAYNAVPTSWQRSIGSRLYRHFG